MKENSKKVYFILSLLVIVLVLFQLFLSNRLTVEGKRLEKIQAEIATLEEENNYLRSKIASLGGLSKLTLVAEEKGFVKNPPVINLTGKVPIAVYSK